MSAPLVKDVANRRYHWLTWPAMAVYCLLVLAISGRLGWQLPRAGVGLYIAAIAPALPIGVVIFAMGRYFSELSDEFIRMMKVKASLLGLGLTLFTCTAWGFLAQYAHVWASRMSLVFVFPIWVLWMWVAELIVKLKYR